MNKGNPVSHTLLKNWSKNSLNKKPKKEADNYKIEFTFTVGEKYPIECTLSAIEPIGILSLVGMAYLNIPDDKVKTILKYTSENSNGSGTFTVNNGWLVYIYSRSIDSQNSSDTLIDSMIAEMDSALLKVAEGVLKLIK